MRIFPLGLVGVLCTGALRGSCHAMSVESNTRSWRFLRKVVMQSCRFRRLLQCCLPNTSCRPFFHSTHFATLTQQEERLKEAFERLDVDSTGFISRDNLEAVLGSTYDSGLIDKMLKVLTYSPCVWLNHRQIRSFLYFEENYYLVSVYGVGGYFLVVDVCCAACSQVSPTDFDSSLREFYMYRLGLHDLCASSSGTSSCALGSHSQALRIRRRTVCGL